MQVRVERLDQSTVQLASVRDADVSGALARAVEIIRQDLVGDEQAQKLVRADSWQGPEQSSAVDVGALAVDCRKRVVTQSVVRDGRRNCAPAVDLARHLFQPPPQLTGRRASQGAQRPD